MEKECDDSYELTTNLAYKEHSTFTFTPESSNIHKKYKTAIVPISLYRIFSWCSEVQDIGSHLEFLNKIVKARKQDEVQVQKKIKNFFNKRKDLGRSEVKKR